METIEEVKLGTGEGTFNTDHSSRPPLYSGMVTALVTVAVAICNGRVRGEGLVAWESAPAT